MLLSWRRVVERPFASAARFRWLVKDYEGNASTLADLHLATFACLILKQGRATDHRSITASSSLSDLHLVSGRGLRCDQAASRRLWSLRQL